MSTPIPPETAPSDPELPPPTNPPPPSDIEQIILTLTAARGLEKSICPSEVARALLPGSGQERWQSLMTPVRQAAIRLVAAGRIDILRKGKPVAVGDVKGVIRLRTRGDAP